MKPKNSHQNYWKEGLQHEKKHSLIAEPRDLFENNDRARIGYPTKLFKDPYFLTIIPRARMGSESIAHDAEFHSFRTSRLLLWSLN